MSAYSLVIICPAALRDSIRTAAAANGHGPDNIRIPLSADGSEPPTHYGSRAWASESFMAELSTYPQAMRDACVIDIRPDASRAGHFDAVLAANNLNRVEDI